MDRQPPRSHRPRVVLAVAAAVATAIAAAPAGHAAPTATPASCGTVTVEGKTWRVAAISVTCAKAKGVVRRVAVKTVPPALVFPGTYEGLRCLGRPPTGRKPTKIICANPPRLVDAAVKGS